MLSARAVPETVLRLAVLLQAGLAPVRAWQHLADAGDDAAGRISRAVGDGMPLADAVGSCGPSPAPPSRRTRAARAEESAVWAEVAAAWRVATTVGAPLAESLRGVAAALRDAQEAADDVRVALAEPAGTARLMAWLPLVALGLGAALGFDTFGVLLAQPLGVACLAAGAALIFAARRWTTGLVRRARAESGIPGLGAELLAIALSSGVSIERATAVVAQAGAAPEESVAPVLRLSRSAGVPAVELLRASAALARHRARVDGRLRAAQLSSRLLLPLGTCTLPAFLLLGVAPMLLSVMSTMPTGF
ncbi:pilus assembly protein TadB [Microbacterium sp. HJ5]